MVFPKEEKLVHSLKLSSVGPSKVTGTDVVHHLKPMDLAMKLHYLTGLYYFSRQAAQVLTISNIKEAMFECLNMYYIVCGRLKRWPETGRPYIKCNDCGVRIIEAACDKTVEEWLGLMSEDGAQMRNLLIYQQEIGPELAFSPPCLIQITQFKCGGISLGLSWSHVLGDVVAAVDFMNTLSQYLVRPKSVGPKKPIDRISTIPTTPCTGDRHPVALKPVSPVGDHWIYPADCNMNTFIFQLTNSQLNQLNLKFFQSDQTPLFESICAVLWKLISEGRRGVGRVTICKHDSSSKGRSLMNTQKIRVVEAEIVSSDDPMELLQLLRDQNVDETHLIEETVERSNGLGDFIMYGVNLTFVDLLETDLYGMELRGERPVFADYSVGGVGREGVVMVAPGPKDYKSDLNGVVVTVVLPEDEIQEVKERLKSSAVLFDNDNNLR